jgi:hypothetical protein
MKISGEFLESMASFIAKKLGFLYEELPDGIFDGPNATTKDLFRGIVADVAKAMLDQGVPANDEKAREYEAAFTRIISVVRTFSPSLQKELLPLMPKPLLEKYESSRAAMASRTLRLRVLASLIENGQLPPDATEDEAVKLKVSICAAQGRDY